MLNLVATIICTVGAAAQWNKNWYLFSICAIFAVANGVLGFYWIKNKIKNRKARRL